ncbi:nucleic acid-binding protein [Ganoderma leucocontextum]|nr:nucleic acid-binding protein [Ganoderma leucocontextum]
MPPMSLIGQVTKVGYMNKTATITVSRYIYHARTGKRIERSKKYLTHDETNQLRLNDTALIRNCPPISARKRFMLEKVLKSPEGAREELHARQAAEAAARLQAEQNDVATATGSTA